MSSSLPALVIVCFILLTVILFVTLYPFNFCPDNGVHWISGRPGLYFDGQGMAYTDSDFITGTFTAKAVSVELWLKKRLGSKNWGSREIFSFYDGSASPSLLIGEWANRIFLYSRFEKDDGLKWYQLFRPNKRFSRGKKYFVTVTFDEREKAVFIDGELIEKRKIAPGATTYEGFFGRLLLGNSPRGASGWMGEINGLAVYDRVLALPEVARHYSVSRQKGMRSLAGASGLRALYPFDEGSGNMAGTIVGEPFSLHIPAWCLPFKRIILHHPGYNMQIRSDWIVDFILNVFFFIPLGGMLALICYRRGMTVPVVGIVVVIITACGLLSLCIEITQLYLPGRTPSIMDVISNMLGALFGIIIVLLGKKFSGTFMPLKEK